MMIIALKQSKDGAGEPNLATETLMKTLDLLFHFINTVPKSEIHISTYP